jgi:O-methyltransferase involved in polyketide biosynthesis
MTTSVQVELGPVQETLLIPLLARARETAKPRGLLHDPRAVEMVRAPAYDFAKWEGGRSLTGAVLRACMFDRYVENFLKACPHGTVIELGCGLDTRFERLDNGQVRWFDLDLSDVIALRRRFFDETPRRTMIAASLLDCAWMDQVEDAGGPWMFVAEAVLIYLDDLDARCALSSLAQRSPGARIAFDTTAARMVDTQASHDAMRHLPRESWFRWGCDDPHEIESWGANLRLESCETFFDAGRDLLDRLPAGLWLTARFAPFLLRRQANQYLLNVASVAAK